MTEVAKLTSYLKYVDQPQLLQRLNRRIPWLLAAAGTGCVAYDTVRAPQTDRQKRFIRSSTLMALTIAGALLPLYAIPMCRVNFKDVSGGYKVLAEELGQLPAGKIKESLAGIINQSKTKMISPGQIQAFRESFYKLGKNGDELLDHIIPGPEATGWKEIAKELGALSLIGAGPVLGGIAGGALGHALTQGKWRKELKNQAKEGLFQFLANIFLCNIGMMAGMIGLEMLPFKVNGKPIANHRPTRIAAMVGGIALVGVIGGTTIANFFGKNFFNPLFDHGPSRAFKHLGDQVSQHGVGSLFRNLNDERHSEPLDWFLHVDDGANLAVVAGWAWIKPLLPLLYMISGKRSGEGYRNGHHGKQSHQPHQSYPVGQFATTASPMSYSQPVANPAYIGPYRPAPINPFITAQLANQN